MLARLDGVWRWTSTSTEPRLRRWNCWSDGWLVGCATTTRGQFPSARTLAIVSWTCCLAGSPPWDACANA